jgi:hypothetical protein
MATATGFDKEVAAGLRDLVGGVGGAAQVVGAGVADLGVVAGVELPAAPVDRAAGAAGGRRVAVAGVGVAAGLGQADRDRRPQRLAHKAGLLGGGGQPEGAARRERAPLTLGRTAPTAAPMTTTGSSRNAPAAVSQRFTGRWPGGRPARRGRW